jgi:GNAT superfamily N-acetyltransferase
VGGREAVAERATGPTTVSTAVVESRDRRRRCRAGTAPLHGARAADWKEFSMNPKIVIRRFSPEYADGVGDLIVPIQVEEFGIAITRADQPDLARIPEFYQHGDGDFWIAVGADGAVVGSIALLDIGDHRVALRKMFVRADHRGREVGVAQRLLGEALAFAVARGVTDVFLGTTEKFLAAHRFNEKNGFTAIEKGALPPSFPAMAVDSRFYHRRIAAA